MNVLFKTLVLALAFGLPLAANAAEPRPNPLPAPTPVEEPEGSWTGKIDYLRLKQGEIVVGDRMFLLSTTTIVTRGKLKPATLEDLAPGSVVRITPILPIPERATPRALQIEIIK
jgi:hypothetical protein